MSRGSKRRGRRPIIADPHSPMLSRWKRLVEEACGWPVPDVERIETQERGALYVSFPWGRSPNSRVLYAEDALVAHGSDNEVRDSLIGTLAQLGELEEQARG